ncbi:hypothetical protein SIL69_004578 [Salmonella enterica]|uniref:Uncharacterized protein n=2 Tax=Salmonella enterica TaxID=28901 RepID=A0A8E6ILM7_SALER|nr:MULTISPECIES: hypothetical protein [Salmonella]EFT2214648.1 hypothetical protein [Salmonella enterica subsp. enterica serovar Adjame]EFU6965831.1 hypothetical protein [Salmonella enterica subsp. enterica serovar Tennessee]EHK3917158.1 hypothetical protein [Salmonella enterica subsp. enterica serovar Poona]EHK8187249.1 hypothetical protein [Salmonella enterica subsp. enterica serovar Chester]EHL3918668.1 hypothetical protein [Salmonella enterica subsp. enterica serovar Saintpaul]EHL9888032.
MNEQELLTVIRITGRYEVVTNKDGTFVVTPLPPESLLITRESHHQCQDYFSKKSR